MRKILPGKATNFISSTRFALAALAVAAIERSFIFFTDSEGGTSTVITELLGTEGVGALWALVAIITVLGVFMKKFRPGAMAVQVGAHVLTGLSLFLSWLVAGFSEQHIAGIGYVLVALLLFWGVSRTTLRPEEVPIPIGEQEVGDD